MGLPAFFLCQGQDTRVARYGYCQASETPLEPARANHVELSGYFGLHKGLDLG